MMQIFYSPPPAGGVRGGVGKVSEPLTKKNQALNKLSAGFSILSRKGRGKKGFIS